jgi:hypothetical protein
MHVDHYHHMCKEQGKIAIQQFVSSGCGFVGVCAGAYLACKTDPNDPIFAFCPTWDLLDSCVVMERNQPEYLWRRGMGPCKVKLSSRGRDMLGHEDVLVDIFYRNGPCLLVDDCVCTNDEECIAKTHVLGLFETEYDGDKTCMNGMKGSVAIVYGQYGEGKVCIYSPHPEISDPLKVVPMLKKSIHFACRSK